jgi:hypothetical protein
MTDVFRALGAAAACHPAAKATMSTPTSGQVEQIARSVAGMPANWVAWQFRSVRPDDNWRRPPNEHDMIEVTGACCPLYVRGPRKGKPNYRKHDKRTKRSIMLSWHFINQQAALPPPPIL